MPAVTPCCRRHDFAACAIDLALEHHRAIVMLVEAGELGTAVALIRPLLEASASAFWLVYAASDEKIMALPTEPAVETSDHDIPMLGEMATALTPYFPAIVGLTEGLSKKATERRVGFTNTPMAGRLNWRDGTGQMGGWSLR